MKKILVAAAALCIAAAFTGCGSTRRVSPVTNHSENSAAESTKPVEPVTEPEFIPDIMLVMDFGDMPYDDMEVMEKSADENGYFYRWYSPENFTTVTSCGKQFSMAEDISAEEFAEDFAQDVLGYEFTSVEVTETELYASGTPAYSISYEYGGNEDSVKGVGVVVISDKYPMIYTLQTSADLYEENSSSYSPVLSHLVPSDADYVNWNSLIVNGAASQDETEVSTEEVSEEEFEIQGE